MPISNKKFRLTRKSFNLTTDNLDGLLVFDNTTHKIYLSGECFSSNVKDVSFNQVTGVITLTRMNDTREMIDLSHLEKPANKVTSISDQSTDDEYPSAKCIYGTLERKGEVVWEVQSVSDGILASETDLSQNPAWQLTNLDMTPYQTVCLYVRSGGTGSSTTASGVIRINLESMNTSPFGHFLGSTVLQNPNNRNRLLALSAAISEDKTKVFFNRCTSLYNTAATSANSDGRVLYKIVGYRAYVESHTFFIVGPNEFTGKNFLLRAKHDGVDVTPNWTVLSGSEAATINRYGRVDINPGTSVAPVTIMAQYGEFSDTKTTTVSYDNQLVINSPDTITGTSGNVVALYNNEACAPVWSITSGNSNATIDAQGVITILQSGSITVQAVYNGYTATKGIMLEYQAGTSQETVIDADGSVTTTTTTESTDPQTGATVTESTSTTTNQDGSTSNTVSETTTNQDGSSTSQSHTTNSDGTSSHTTSNTGAPDPQTGEVVSTSNTVNYDDSGTSTGSTENVTVTNTDGSSSSSTLNYNAEGDPTSGVNEVTDSSQNVSTQDIVYDENGEPEVTGYQIDTSNNADGEKEFNEDGVNTEFYGFDTTHGFVAHIHFTIDFTNQPLNQDQDHHNILTMKRATPEPWYGFQLRQTSNTKSIIIGTQFSTGGNTNTTINPSRWIEANKIGEYDIEVVYDPLSKNDTFVARDLISGNTIFTSNKVFPDLPELRYLTVCIGYALDANGDPYRYSNINVSEFSIVRLAATVADPVISCSGNKIEISCATSGAIIYYKLDHAANYSVYSNHITISADTFIEAYAEYNELVSNVVSQTCIYEAPHDYSQDYLTFRVLTPGTVMWKALGSGQEKTIQYSLNDGAWTSITATSAGVSIPVVADDVIRFRGSNNTYAKDKSNYSGFEGGTANFNVEGNIMSLVNGDNFAGTSTLSGTYNFCSIFKLSNVVSAKYLILPTTTLTNYCYRAMFSKCASLTTAPVLPATTLAQGCYWYMFEECAITDAPDLLATTLVNSCYYYMFTKCTSLNRIKCLATSGLGTTNCLQGWVTNVAAIGTFIKDANTTWSSGANGIPSNWTIVNQ